MARIAGVASLLAAILLCLGPVSSLPGSTGLDAPGVFRTTGWSWADQGAGQPGGGHLPAETAAVAVGAGEEAKGGDEGPINAGLLTALLLGVACFGAIVAWRLTHDLLGRAVFCLSGIARRSSFGSSREALPLLGVLRL